MFRNEDLEKNNWNNKAYIHNKNTFILENKCIPTKQEVSSWIKKYMENEKKCKYGTKIVYKKGTTYKITKLD